MNTTAAANAEECIPPQQDNRALCASCRKTVPAEFVVRDGNAYLRKHCPDCGDTDRLISCDAAAWKAKQDEWTELTPEPKNCHISCKDCSQSHSPTIVFLDVTNRCNMNCPICIATIRGMKFDFNPPLEYFEKIFAALGRFDPPPNVQLFGGEPTVRSDLLDILAIAKKHGLRPCVVTNALKLADEEFVKTMCKAKVRFRLAFDGPREDIYEKLRSRGDVLEKKIAAMENLLTHTQHKHSVVSCVARNINEPYLGEMFQTLHRYPYIRDLGLIPLAENWQEGEFQADESTTPEDVEKFVDAHIDGAPVDFVPTGVLASLWQARSFFRTRGRSEALMLGGVHPNCESFTLLFSDGLRYRSINEFLKIPFKQAAREMVGITQRLKPRLDKLDPHKRLDRLRGQAMILRAFWPLIRKSLDMKRYCRSHPMLSLGRIVLGKLLGKPSRELFRKHLVPQQALRVAVLPFEEYDAIDANRLSNCRAVFAYEDTRDGQVKTIPACIWYEFRNPLLKQISDHYGVACKQDSTSPAETTPVA